jgi:hypothetical protein
MILFILAISKLNNISLVQNRLHNKIINLNSNSFNINKKMYQFLYLHNINSRVYYEKNGTNLQQ